MQSFSTYKISVKGLNLHHLIDYFQKEKIHLIELERINQKHLTCIISKNDYLKLKKTELFKSYKIRIENRFGLESYSRKILTKIGLILGIIVCLFTILPFTNSICDVYIPHKNHTCSNGENCIFTENNIKLLNESLNSLGIYKGAKINKLISNTEIKHKLMLEYKQISDVSIQRKGVCLYVNILESKLPTNQTAQNLIATEKGIVIKTDVTSGKLKVKIGDVVLKGDTLIENTGNPACGTITLRSFFNESIIYNEEQTNYKRTGKSKTFNNISFFNLSSKSKNNINYQIYETDSSVFYPFKNNLLPIKIHRTTYYELEKIINTIPFDLVKDSLYEKLREQTRLKLPINAEEKNTTYTLKQEGSRYLINCYIEAYITLTI